MKQTIKLRESELKRMIAESVNSILMHEGFGNVANNMTQAARNGMFGQQAQSQARQGANAIQQQQSRNNMQQTGQQQQAQNNGNVVNQLKMIQQTINQILRQMGG